MEEEIEIAYTDDFENLLKNESEISESMSILHLKSYEYFSKFATYLNIPIIILSAIVGFLSPLDLFTKQAILLGSISILVSILKTIDNYFDLTKRSETHRLTSLSYGRISKFIQIQLSLEKEARIKAKDLLVMIQNDLQNLKDSEPLIPKRIIIEYNEKYKSEPTAKPPITNGLTTVKINKSSLKAYLTPPPSLTLPPMDASASEALPASGTGLESKPKKPVWK